MNTPLAPSRYVIRAISPDPQAPENETYRARTQLNNGACTSDYVAKGINDVRFFLLNGMPENVLNRAIDELRRLRETDVRL